MDLLNRVYEAQKKINGVALVTPLVYNENLSDDYQAKVFLKREDLQPVRSYKLRGAYHKMINLSDAQKKLGVVCASAGNHAQGVAYACEKLGIQGRIFMPITTPQQKINQVKRFGKDQVHLVLVGDTFDEAFTEAQKYVAKHQVVLIHPFDDEDVIAGQGTIGLELLEASTTPIDYVFVPIGGGGLAAGICTVFKHCSPNTKIIGVEPLGAASMKASLENNINTTLKTIDKFVDGAAVKRVGDLTFSICKESLTDVVAIPEGKVCSMIIQLYNEEALVVEPAGALALAALDLYREELIGKHVICLVSGSNNDSARSEEIKERALLYEGLKRYFVINFPQRTGALREFVTKVLGEKDDITYFQFDQKNSRDFGPAVVGIHLQRKEDFTGLLQRLKHNQFEFRCLNEKEDLFTHLIRQ